MRYYTDLYIQALKAGAKPLIHCYIKSDYAWRCFGKEYPKEAHLRTDIDVYEWQARVLNFGDYRVSLASESENVFLALQTQEMNSYTITLDNADRYFTTLLEDEVLFSGGLYLYQGFAYPAFTFADYLPLFSGKISKVDLSTTECQLTADTIIKPAEPEDPAVDTTTTYSLSIDLETETAAEEELTYETLESWYELEAWTLVLEIDRTADDTEEVLLSIVNAADSAIRLEVGIDADDKLYLKYDTDIDDSSTTETLTGFNVGTDYTRLVIQVDPTADPPVVTFTDNHNNIVQEELDTETIWNLTTLATSISQPKGCTVDAQGNIYLCEDGAKMLQIYDNEGNLDDEFSYTTSASFVCLDEYENVYVSALSSTAPSVRKYNPSGGLQWNLNTSGSGDGQFNTTGPAGVAVSPNSNLYVVDSGNNRIQYFTLAGSYVGQWGDALEFPGYVVDIDFDTLGNCVVLQRNGIIRRYTESGVFLNEFGSDTGSYGCYSIEFSEWGETFVADLSNDCIYRYDYTYNYVETIATGEANFFGITSKNVLSVNTLYATDFVSSGNLIKIEREDVPVPPDFSDNGSDDTVEILPNNDNTELISATILDENGDPVLQWQNVGEAAATDLVDQIGDADVALADGVWTEYGTIEVYTEELTYVEQVSYDTVFIPATTDLYTNSSQQNVFLPLPYGDMTENSDAGAWVVPCINTITYTYCVAGWPVVSIANGNSVSVYVDGVLQTSGYTFYENNNYLGLGGIAIIVFDSDKGNSTVTVKCKGRDDNGDGTGTLLTNPIDIVEDLIVYAANTFGVAPWAVDELSFALAKEEATQRSYLCAGVIASTNSLSYWIKSILACFLMTHEFDNEGKLAIRFLTYNNTEDIKETIEEYEAIKLSASQDAQTLCNRLIINYASSYAEIDKRYKTGGEISYYRTFDSSDTESTRKYGEYLQELDYNWTRNTSTVQTVTLIILTRYASPLWNIFYTGQDIKFLPLDLLDQVEGTFNFFPGQSAIAELRERVINLDDFTTAMTLQIVDFEEITDEIGNVYVADISGNVYIATTSGFVYIAEV